MGHIETSLPMLLLLVLVCWVLCKGLATAVVGRCGVLSKGLAKTVVGGGGCSVLCKGLATAVMGGWGGGMFQLFSMQTRVLGITILLN